MKLLEFPEQKGNAKELLEGFAIIAEGSMIYYKELMKQGFTEQQALDIVKAVKWW